MTLARDQNYSPALTHTCKTSKITDLKTLLKVIDA